MGEGTSPEGLEAARRSLSNIFYYMPSYSKEGLSMLQQFIQASTTTIGEYIREAMLLRQITGNKTWLSQGAL